MPTSSKNLSSASAENVKYWLVIWGLSDAPNPGWSTTTVRYFPANTGRLRPKLLHPEAPGPPPCSMTTVSPSPAS
jgi:hypothetical protein